MSIRTADAVAIIGIGCRYAGADGVEQFWSKLCSGASSITRDPSLDTEGETRRIGSWGLMENRTVADYQVTGAVAPRADHDPQHGLLYETLWAAAEDAGVRFSDIGEATAVYAGCARVRYVERGPFADAVDKDATFAGPHFSYFQDLQRESIMVDSSCATGLVAVHLACQSLRLEACDYALAGAVSVMDTDGSYTYTPTGIYSSEGICRPFDTASTGTVPGDGVGAVLLRRLDDALRDGDPVHAVIRTSAVGNDGRSKAGFVIPGVQGKIRVVRQALAQAGLTGADLGYAEAHGVGIPMNDQIEATALTEALGPGGPPLFIGSVKASIGHTDTAAGIASMIKASLALEHGFLPATPNTSSPIEELTRGGGRFGILPEGRPWIPETGPLRAGVMSAGIGGTNAFAILEEPPASAAGLRE